jgi:two-component system chemotaxis response regulator CheY
MKTRPINRSKLPETGAVLIARKQHDGSPDPVIVDHAVPGRAAVRVVPHDRDDFELTHDELVNDWCEVVGDDARRMRGYFWPLFQTLVVVDSDLATLRRHRDELGRSLNLLTAADAAEALELFGHERVDAVLAELTLPDQDGISLLAQIRNVRPQTRRLLTSAHQVPRLNEHLASGLVERFFRKPLAEDELLEHLIRPAEPPDDIGTPTRH